MKSLKQQMAEKKLLKAQRTGRMNDPQRRGISSTELKLARKTLREGGLMNFGDLGLALINSENAPEGTISLPKFVRALEACEMKANGQPVSHEQVLVEMKKAA